MIAPAGFAHIRFVEMAPRPPSRARAPGLAWAGVHRQTGGSAVGLRLWSDEFDALYRRIAPQMLRYFAARVGDRDLAADLTATAFVIALEKSGELRGRSEAQVTAWIWSIARSQLARHRRYAAIESSAFARLALERTPDSHRDFSGVESRGAREHAASLLRDAVDRLSTDQIEVLVLRFVEGLGYGEIAERLNVSSSVARARVSRAVRVLAADRILKEALRLMRA